jgi:phosphoglycerate dehydrogenase-like enzyme
MFTPFPAPAIPRASCLIACFDRVRNSLSSAAWIFWLIGEHELRALPRHAFLLNPARGPIIQQDALLRALRENWIAGAALDTHYQYPMPPDHPLWAFPNVTFTPHISGSSLSPNFKTRLWDIFLSNLERFTSGGPLLNELSVSQLNGA